MKKINILLVCITIIFSSCGIHSGLTTNSNVHSTDVVLSKKNFKVIARVKGTAQTRRMTGETG